MAGRAWYVQRLGMGMAPSAGGDLSGDADLLMQKDL